MPEIQQDRAKFDAAQQLGSHVTEAIRAHQARHHDATREAKTEIEQAKIVEQREQELDSLYLRVNAIASADHIEQDTAGPYPVETLDTGVKLDGSVTPKGSGGLVHAARNLFNRDPDTPGGKYVANGPLSESLGRTNLGRIDGRKAEQKAIIDTGLALHVSLDSVEEFAENHPPVHTRDQVLVGVVIDPRSILVPVDSKEQVATLTKISEDSEQPREISQPEAEIYKIIGPDDSRFAPILDLLSHIDENFARGKQPAHRVLAETEHSPEVRLIAASSTEKGEKYDKNHDAYFVGERALGVFDGVGTRFPSEQAAQAASTAVKQFLASQKPEDQGQAEAAVFEALTKAHYAASEAGARTTAAITLAWKSAQDGRTYITAANVGDSYIGVQRAAQDPESQKQLQHLAPEVSKELIDEKMLLIKDLAANADSYDTLVGLMRASGEFYDDEDNSIDRALRRYRDTEGHQLYQALGRGEPADFYPSIETVEFNDGDLLVLMTDGITDPLLRDTQIAPILASEEPEQAIVSLFHAAKHEFVEYKRKKDDDKTVIIARLV